MFLASTYTLEIIYCPRVSFGAVRPCSEVTFPSHSSGKQHLFGVAFSSGTTFPAAQVSPTNSTVNAHLNMAGFLSKSYSQLLLRWWRCDNLAKPRLPYYSEYWRWVMLKWLIALHQYLLVMIWRHAAPPPPTTHSQTHYRFKWSTYIEIGIHELINVHHLIIWVRWITPILIWFGEFHKSIFKIQ